MKDWQQNFLQKLEGAKKQWLHRFERFATDHLEPAFDEYADFATSNGFRVSTPDCEDGMRRYKFALTENGYVLLTFQMKGLEQVEVCIEAAVPGQGAADSADRRTELHLAGPSWAETQFQDALDSFLTAFAEAGANDAERAEELVTA